MGEYNGPRARRSIESGSSLPAARTMRLEVAGRASSLARGGLGAAEIDTGFDSDVIKHTEIVDERMGRDANQR
jgi:hypothetical protein